MKKTDGFTLIEILLVVFIGAIIISAGFFASYGSSFVSDIVRTNTDQIIALMRKTQMQSLTGQPGAPYSIEFTTNLITVHPSEETLILSDVELSSIQLSGGVNTISYSTSLGKPSVTGSVTVRGLRGNSRNIIISPSGVIDWQIL